MTLIGGSRDRRRWPRVPVQINVQVGIGVRVVTVANLRDISAGGAYIELQGPLNPAIAIATDEHVLARFLLPGTTSEVELSGRVVRLDREHAEGPVLGLGVEFLSVPAAARALIDAYVSAQLTAARR